MEYEDDLEGSQQTMCTRKALWAAVWGLAVLVIAAVCLENTQIEPDVGDQLIFIVLFFIPMLAFVLQYSYRFYIGANWGVMRRRGPSDMRSMVLFIFGFCFPPCWLVNIFLYSSTEFQRTKFWVGSSVVMTIIGLCVLFCVLLP